MAISIVNSAVVLESTDNTNSYDSSTYTPDSNDNLLVVFLLGQSADSLSETPPTITSILWGATDISGGQEAIVAGAARSWVAAYTISSPGTSAQDISIALDDMRALGIAIVELSGFDASPVTSTQTTFGETTSGSLNFTTSDDGALILAGFAVEGDSTPIAAADGATELLEGNTGGTGFNDVTFNVVYEVDASAGSETVGASWGASDRFAAVGIEIKPAAVAATGTVGSGLVTGLKLNRMRLAA